MSGLVSLYVINMICSFPLICVKGSYSTDEAGAWRSGGLRLDLPHFPRGAHEIGGGGGDDDDVVDDDSVGEGIHTYMTSSALAYSNLTESVIS